ncbi:MAG TPA: sigma-54-dependent Fis family transcriptional regulator [Gammaproteobacteria bacterium]|nr:sigma-54-dependent Fis family transcriptional regulator [Gammaproteobacteria bacterium]
MGNSLLIIEDESLLGDELSRHFKRQGYRVELATTIQQARYKLLKQKLEPLIVISDINLPDGNGLDLLAEVGNTPDVGEWLFLTAFGSVPESVRALQLGAYDFLEKPCDLERLDLVVASAQRSALAQRRLKQQRNVQTQRYSVDAFIGSSPQAQQTRTMLKRLSEISFNSLIISGETGTGKGLAAKILHHTSARADAPFIAVNCAALPHDLLESELFGHEIGAFTGAKKSRRGLFEQADGGTLFLDEIGEMSLELQSKLLKAIEDQTIRRLGSEIETEIDIQIIAASNRNFSQQVSEGRFRSDLYHRLSLFELKLPSLKERKEDLQVLVPALIKEFNLKAKRHQVSKIPQPVWQQLNHHHWPGNVRELRNVIERCVLFAEGDELPLQWLQLDAARASTTIHDENSLIIPLDGSMNLAEMECHIIKTALKRCNNNTTATARMLGTSREKLRYRQQKYGL